MTKRKKSTPTPGEQIAQQILENYDLKDAQDVQDALKQVFGPIFEAVLKGEMQNHLGYEKNGHAEDSTNARNGYSRKTLKTSLGEVPIRVPRDRQGQFEPQIVKKHQRDVSSIEGKVLAMYARGMSQRDIAATIEDIYGFQLSHEQISNITDCVMEEVDRWRTRPLNADRTRHPSGRCLCDARLRYQWVQRRIGALDQRNRKQACLDADFR